MMPSRNPDGPLAGPAVPPKATQTSSELMTRAKRPRARHHAKPFKVS